MPELGLPDLGDETLLATLDDWLRPAFAGKTRLDALSVDDLAGALKAPLDWPLRQRVEQLAPTHVDVPSGMQRRIDYAISNDGRAARSEEPTSELQSLMRTSYAVFCL